MVVEGEIKRLVSDEDITSKDGSKTYMKRIFVMEVGDKYKDEFAVEIFGKANQRMPELREGDIIKLNFTISSREWQDKFFTSIRAIYIEIVTQAAYGAKSWASGGNREKIFADNQGGHVTTPPKESQSEYLDRLAKEQGYESVDAYNKSIASEKYQENDLPF